MTNHHDDDNQYHSEDHIQRQLNLKSKKAIVEALKKDIQNEVGKKRENTEIKIKQQKNNIKKLEYINKQLVEHEKKYIEIAKKIDIIKQLTDSLKQKQNPGLLDKLLTDLDNAFVRLSTAIQSISQQYDRKFDASFFSFTKYHVKTAKNNFNKAYKDCSELIDLFQNETEKHDSWRDKRDSRVKIPSSYIQQAFKEYNEGIINKKQALERFAKGDINENSAGYRESRKLLGDLLSDLDKLNKQEIEQEIENNDNKLPKSK